MADWRDSGEEKRPKKQKKSAKKPAKSQGASGAGSWLGKRKDKSPRPAAGSEQESRKWHGSNVAEDGGSLAGLFRLSSVLFLLFVFVVGAVWYWTRVWNNDRLLPVLVFSTGKHPSTGNPPPFEILETPGAETQRKSLLLADAAGEFIVDKGNGNDALAAVIRKPDWSSEFDKIHKDAEDKNLILGGGPGNRFALLYVNACALVDTNDKKLFLVPPDVKPFAVAGGSWGEEISPGAESKLVELGEFLTSAAKATHSSSKVWVVLDLFQPQLPGSVVPISTQWESIAKETFERLGDDERGRILVTLPCGDGQNNWFAPEFSASYFGYTFLQHLRGEFDKSEDWSNNVSLDKLRKSLDERVRSATRVRRYAEQTPVWIAEDFEALEELPVLKVGKGDPQKPIRQTIDFSLAKEAWKRIEENKNCLVFDPFKLSRMEVLALALEQACFERPAGAKRLKEEFDKVAKSVVQPKVTFGVSLEEDQRRRKYYSENMAPSSKSSSSANLATMPDYLQRNLTTEQDQPEEESEAKVALPSAEEAWSYLLRVAQSNDVDKWNDVFQQKSLNNLLINTQQSEEPKSLEMLLVQRIAEDIDWGDNATNMNRAKACARVISCYSLLQRIAACPDPLLADWSLKKIETLETRWLHACDELLANQFDQANSMLDGDLESDGSATSVATELIGIYDDLTQLEENVRYARLILKEAPQHLNWMVQDHYYFGAGEHKNDLKNLAQAVNKAIAIESQLRDQDINDLLQDDEVDLKVALDRVRESFNQRIVKETPEAGDTNKYTGSAFLKQQIALSTTLLTPSLRSTLHGTVSEFVKKMAEDDLSTPEIFADEGQQANYKDQMELLAPFFNTLDEKLRPDWKAHFERMHLAIADPKKFGSGYPYASLSSPTKPGMESAGTEMLEAEWTFRIHGYFWAQCLTICNKLRESRQDNEWQWNAVRQSWALADGRWRLGQQQRLARAKWGPGRGRDKLPFMVFAKQYEREEHEDYREVKDALAKWKKVAEDSLLASELDIRNLRLSLSSSRGASTADQPKIDVKVAVEGHARMKDRAASVRLLRQEKILSIDGSNLRVEVHGDGETTIPERYWSNEAQPKAQLAFRGHFKSKAIPQPPKPGALPSFSFENEKGAGATLRFQPSNLPPLDVYILLDCSATMNYTIEVPREAPLPPTKVPLRVQMQLSVLNLVNLLSNEIDGRTADVKITFMPFGLKVNGKKRSELEGLGFRAQDGDGPYSYNSIWTTDPLRPNNELFDNLLRSETLPFDGETPLYNAIYAACSKVDEERRSKIYVFSDGANNVGTEEYRYNNDVESITDLIESKSLRPELNILTYFDEDLTDDELIEKDIERHKYVFDRVPQTVRQNMESPKAYAQRVRNPLFSERQSLLEELREELAEGGTALEESQKLGKKYGFSVQADDLDLIAEGLRSSLKGTEVKVERLSGFEQAGGSESEPFSKKRSLTQKGKANVPIEQQQLPGRFKLEIMGPAMNFKDEISLFGGEDIELRTDDQGFSYLEDFPEESYTIEGNKRPSSGGLTSRAYVKWDARTDETLFRVGFQNTNRDSFTVRPQFLIAKLQDPEPLFGFESILLASHRVSFVEGAYPEATYPTIAKDLAKESLTIWAADKIPVDSKWMKTKVVTRKPGEAPDTIDFEGASIELQFDGSRLVANITYPQGQTKSHNPIAIVCPDFQSVTRRFSEEQRLETFEYTVNERENVVLWLSSEKQLNAAVQAGLLTEFTF